MAFIDGRILGQLLPRCRLTGNNGPRHGGLNANLILAAVMHSELQRIFFETRSTNSSSLESKSFRMGDSFDLL
jgi:hypothetical protein